MFKSQDLKEQSNFETFLSEGSLKFTKKANRAPLFVGKILEYLSPWSYVSNPLKSVKNLRATLILVKLTNFQDLTLKGDFEPYHKRTVIDLPETVVGKPISGGS